MFTKNLKNKNSILAVLILSFGLTSSAWAGGGDGAGGDGLASTQEEERGFSNIDREYKTKLPFNPDEMTIDALEVKAIELFKNKRIRMLVQFVAHENFSPNVPYYFGEIKSESLCK